MFPPHQRPLPLDHNRHILHYHRDSSVHGSNQSNLSRQTLSLGLRTVPQTVTAITTSAYIVNHRSTSKRSIACTQTRLELPFHDSLSRFSNCNRRLHRSSVRPMAQSARISTQLNTDSRSPSIARIGLPAMSLTLLTVSLSANCLDGFSVTPCTSKCSITASTVYGSTVPVGYAARNCSCNRPGKLLPPFFLANQFMFSSVSVPVRTYSTITVFKSFWSQSHSTDSILAIDFFVSVSFHILSLTRLSSVHQLSISYWILHLIPCTIFLSDSQSFLVHLPQTSDWVSAYYSTDTRWRTYLVPTDAITVASWQLTISHRRQDRTRDDRQTRLGNYWFP
ncbi:hypothetical protein F2Q69_00020518 [Brassica cretica]|uniref:Uncharacterized protein n=1 Tax=Brassica cretica TaxID=69181 RepID=A0A8S9QAW8_BRACR|nr:hypothetical protein F2Q69_00020518 [Brassica cretica]